MVTFPSGLTSHALAILGTSLAGVVVVEELVVLGDPVAVGGVEGPGEGAAPGAAVFPDLAQRLDDEGILADPLLDRRELARLDQLGELRGFLEALRDQGGISDDLGSLQLTDELCAQLRLLGGGGSADAPQGDLRRGDGEKTETQHGAPRQPGAFGSRDVLVIGHGISLSPRPAKRDRPDRRPADEGSHPNGPASPCQSPASLPESLRHRAPENGQPGGIGALPRVGGARMPS